MTHIIAFLAPVVIFLFLMLFTRTAKVRKEPVADLLAYSVGEHNHLPLSSWYLEYPRFFHSEVMTHKDFSRSAASSRAIPIKKQLAQVWSDPAVPYKWGKNQPGMQASSELSSFKAWVAENIWINTGKLVVCFVWLLNKLNVHKQVGNRLLEPWVYIKVTLTTCKTANFFALRNHKDAQPEFQALAALMQSKLEGTVPLVLKEGEWHLPWITSHDYKAVYQYPENQRNEVLRKMSAARCARSSYGNFGKSNVERDLKTYSKLVETLPVHASPCEHQATPDYRLPNNRWANPEMHGNLIGYVQHRKLVPNHYVEDVVPPLSNL